MEVFYESKDGTICELCHDELYHFKYFKREKINGKWKYWYKKITNKVKKSYSKAEKKTVSAAKTVAKTIKSVSKNIADTAESVATKSMSAVESAVSKPTKKFKYIKKELINGKWRYWYADDLPKDTSDNGQSFLDKLFGKKESNGPKVEVKKPKEEQEKKMSRKERAEYEKAQDKERNGVRKKELDKILETLKKPNTWFKKNNPLPDVKLKKSATTLDEDMRLVNPNYKTNKSNYDQNCTSCTMAYDLRRRGYDVEAKSEKANTKNGRTVTTISDVADCYRGAKIVSQKDLKKKYDYSNTKGLVKAVEKDMLSHGEGSRGNLVVAWSAGGGHSVSWEVEKGEVVVRDCQTGQKRSLDDYSGRISDACYMRTDNLEVNDNVEQYVQDRKGK